MEETSTEAEDSATVSLEEQVVRLREEKIAAEREFGNKRAVFKSMFMENKNEIARLTALLQNSQADNEVLQRHVDGLQSELEDLKTAAAVSEVGRQDEINSLRNHYQEEVASLQHIVRESVAEAVEKASAKYNEAKQIWREERQELQSKLDDSRRQGGWRDKDPGVLDVFAKTFRRMTAPNSTSSIPSDGVLTTEETEEAEGESLEESMRRAQADVDMLKSIVMPYEEEIAALKHKVREAYSQIDALEETQLKRDLDAARKELDVEKGQVEALRKSWQRDNDHFLAQLRHHLMDVQRMEALLNDEQKSQLGKKSPGSSCRLNDASDKDSSSLDGEALATATPKRRAVSNQDLSVGPRRDSPPEVRSLFEFVNSPDEFSSQRLVSEREWSLLQQEVTSARRRLSRPCELCANYEDQLQTLQANFGEKDKKHRLVSSELEKERQLTLDLRTCLTELESRNGERREEMLRLLQEKEGGLTALRSDFNQYKISLDNQLEVLFAERDQLYRDLNVLQRETDSFLDRHSAHARLLQSEQFQLSSAPDELQMIVLQLREELISCRAARDHIEEKLRGELAFLRDQMKGEQQEKVELEASVQDLTETKLDDLARLHSIQSEYEREKRVRSAVESELTQVRHEQSLLQKRSDELESEVVRLRQRAANLTGDLATAEEVQKDFVHLSQSLQIQLERLRQEHTSLRWQDKTSAGNCTGCQRNFASDTVKLRCKHCVRIFCPACCGVQKVQGLPVCNVCHTLLVQDAVPFFSNS